MKANQFPPLQAKLAPPLFICILAIFLPLASARGDGLPIIPVPEEDYGVWVSETQPCTSATRIVVEENKITFHLAGRAHEFRELSVYLSCASGSSGDAIAHCIFPTRNVTPAFHLWFFPGEDKNKLIYEILRPHLLESDFPSADMWFNRCPSVR